MVRALFFGIAALLLMGNTPKEQAWSLMEQGRDAEAFALIEDGAAQGDAESIDYLAWFYDTGRFVEQDLRKAAGLYSRAAALNVGHAQWRLGVMIDEGTAPGELTEAVELFKAAAAQDFSNGWVSLGVMQAAGRGTPQDLLAARASFEKAARLGNPHAFNEIGVMYATGEGVPIDFQEALAWMIVAAMGGDQTAQNHLANSFTDKNVDPEAAAARAKDIAAEFGSSSTVEPA